jgi:SH3-like domain-containing protein
VIEGSRFAAGQQLRVNSPDSELNLRAAPSRNAGVYTVLSNGSYVAILAGPVNAEGVEWWQVQAASGQRGWIAARIGENDVLTP